jgi:hypothetical protein
MKSRCDATDRGRTLEPAENLTTLAFAYLHSGITGAGAFRRHPYPRHSLRRVEPEVAAGVLQCCQGAVVLHTWM